MNRRVTDEQKHIVYRLFDKDDRLLYVGVTIDLEARSKAHRSQTPWWPEVLRAETIAYDGRSLAYAARARAIEQEEPLRNQPLRRSPKQERRDWLLLLGWKQTGNRGSDSWWHERFGRGRVFTLAAASQMEAGS